MRSIFASETVAFDVVGAELSARSNRASWSRYRSSQARSGPQPPPVRHTHPRPCIFEHVYFSRPDSIVDGQSASIQVRKQSARSWPRNPVEADLVIPVPDSGVPAAIGYAQQSGIPFELGIIRSHYVGRTFIQPGDGARHSA
jgi:amidophosphoribosyltransferase